MRVKEKLLSGAKAALVLSVVGLTAACGAQGGAQEDGVTRVVTSYSILNDMVQNVAGKHAETTVLVGAAEDTHTFEASPSDSRALAEADLVFENGVGFEPWLDDAYSTSGSEARRVVVSGDIEPIEGGEHGHEHEEENEDGHEAGHEEEHGELDPHVWHDPENAVVMVEAVRDALVKADPGNAGDYRRNAREYIAEIEKLDSEIEGRVDRVPEENRKLVTSHDTFGYFAERYGFEEVGAAIPSLTTESSDPSAGETAKLAEEMREENVRAVFPEQLGSDSQILERIASEADAELAPPLYTDALGEPGNEGDTYLSMMRYNARTVTEALRK